MPKKAIVSKKVDLKGYGTVWSYPYDIETFVPMQCTEKPQGYL